MMFHEIKGRKIRCEVRDGYFCIQPRVDGRLKAIRHLLHVGERTTEKIIEILNSAQSAQNCLFYFIFEHKEYTMLFDADDNLIIGIGIIYC
jgi:hypothetical protein